MTEPTEYPIPLPVTPKMADRMRAAGWAPVVGAADDYTRAIRVTRVIDGDTFVADVDLGYHTTAVGITFRVARINAPEMRGPTRDYGIAARTWAANWIALHADHRFDNGGLFATSLKTDDWRRYIAEITCADGHNLSDDMLAAGQAVVYK